MKFFIVLFYSVCLLFMFTISAFAYIDPSSVTYIIQIIAGIVIASGTAIGIIISRVKRKIRTNSTKEEVTLNDNIDDSNFAD